MTDSRSESATLTAHGVCLLRRLLVSLAITISASNLCLAQNDLTEADQAITAEQDAAGVDDRQKQRTAATAMATLVGIALAGVTLLFIVVLLGAWARRMASERKDGRAAVDVAPESAPEAGRPDVDPPVEDEA